MHRYCEKLHLWPETEIRGRLSLPPVAEYMLNARESENLAAALLPLYLPPFNAS